MLCPECDSLFSAYVAATKRYAVVVQKYIENGVHIPALSEELADARLDCQRFREALHVHRDSHRRWKPIQR